MKTKNWVENGDTRDLVIGLALAGADSREGRGQAPGKGVIR